MWRSMRGSVIGQSADWCQVFHGELWWVRGVQFRDVELEFADCFMDFIENGFCICVCAVHEMPENLERKTAQECRNGQRYEVSNDRCKAVLELSPKYPIT